MPIYLWNAKTRSGDKKKGELEASISGVQCVGLDAQQEQSKWRERFTDRVGYEGLRCDGTDEVEAGARLRPFLYVFMTSSLHRKASFL